MTPARGNSVTVQQALALWNDAFIAQHCEHAAKRIENDVARQVAPTQKSSVIANLRIERAFQLILGRSPSAKETDDVSDFTRQHGLANLCRLLFNSNEFLFVN